MKIFKDCYVTGKTEDLLKFKNDIINYITGDWRLGTDARFFENYIVITYVGDLLSKASVFLYLENITNMEISIANIVPNEKNNLDFDEYNVLLEKCVQDCIKPCAHKLGLNITVTSENVDIENYMSPISAKKLRRFSSYANKSTGSNHSTDQALWNDFICQTFYSNEKRNTTILSRWLTEEEGWRDEIASRLISEYEYGLDLLKYYNEQFLKNLGE